MSKVKKKIILGITGGIASGKTTVTRMLSEAGIPTISSDDLAHQAIRKGTPVYRRILKRFGRTLLRESEQICRTDLGKIVFRDPVERKWLERQIHPVVVHELKRFIREHHGVMALDIPLLFEAKLDRLVDKTVVVYSTRAQQIERLRRRNDLDRAEALRRINAQMPLFAKRRRADIVLDNSGMLASLRSQIHKKLLT